MNVKNVLMFVWDTLMAAMAKLKWNEKMLQDSVYKLDDASGK